MKRPPGEEALRWLIQAQDEFQDADELRRRNRFYIALFHFQQSVKEALKAFLYWNTRSTAVFYTHSVAELSRMAADADRDFDAILPAKRLDQYYIPTRYPNGLPGGIPSRYYDDPAEAEEAMLLARGVLDLVERKLKEAKSG